MKGGPLSMGSGPLKQTFVQNCVNKIQTSKPVKKKIFSGKGKKIRKHMI